MSVIHIKETERKPVLFLFLIFFAIVSATITGSAVRDAVFLTQFDKSYLPVMFVAIAIIMAIVIPLYKKLTKDIDIITVITTTGSFFALTLFFIQPILNGLIIPALYIWIEIMAVIFILQFWLLAGEIFNARQAKRLFTLIGAGGSIAGLAAGYGIKPFVSTFGSEKLLFLTIGFIGMSIVLAQSIKPYRRKQQRKPFQNKPKPPRKKGFDPYIKSIAVLIGLSAFISKVVDYQFKMMAVSSFPIQNDLVNYFGTYYMATGAATLIMQFFITGIILTKFGLLAGLLILPLTLIIGSSGFLIMGTLSAVFIAKFSDQVFKFSTNNTVQELLWLPVSSDNKKEVKPIIDGTIRSGLEGLAGILIFSLVSFKLVPSDKIHWLSLFVILGSGIWIWNSFRLKGGYVKSLVKAIDNRQLNLDQIDFDIENPQIVKTLNETLLSEDEHKQLFALELLKPLPLYPWKETLNTLIRTGSQQLRLNILKLTWFQKEIISDQDLISLATSESSKFYSRIILCASDRKIHNFISGVENSLLNNSVEISTAAAIALIKNNENHELAHKTLIKNINSNEEQLVSTLGLLKHLPTFLNDEQILSLLKHNSYKVKNAVLSILCIRDSVHLIDLIILQLESPNTYLQAIKVFTLLPVSMVESKLINTLQLTNLSVPLRRNILQTLIHFPSKQTIQSMIDQLNHPSLVIVDSTANSLISLSKEIEFENYGIEKIDQIIGNIAKEGFQLYVVLNELESNENSHLIVDQIKYDLRQIIPIIIKLGTLQKPDIPIETYIQYVNKQDPDLLPIVLELVDSTFSSENRLVTLPLIDHEIDKSKKAVELFDDLLNADNFLLNWVNPNQTWKTVLAIQYFIKSEKINILKQIQFGTIPNSTFDQHYFNKHELEYIIRNFLKDLNYPTETTSMYSILEKTLKLKSVDLFKSIPGDILKQISQIAQEVTFNSNERIFSEGDYGDSMFIILSGQVNIEQNGKLITTLGMDECIGEIALLDQEPRSADAITSKETILLKIDQEGFYQLMASNPDIMKQIVKMLSQRLREMNAKLIQSKN